MHEVFVLLLLFQSADYPPSMSASKEAQRRETELHEVAVASKRPASSAAEENRKRYAAAREQEFVEKFNKLIQNLMDFADSYKSGHAVDVKKAKSIRKAWLDLEKSEPIFQDDREKPSESHAAGGRVHTPCCVSSKAPSGSNSLIE